MKKIKYLLLLILLIPIFVLAESNIEIKSVELIEKSKYVEELKTPSYKDLKLSFNLKFVNLNDYANYKVVVKNNTDKDYEIDNSEMFNDGEYIKYEFIVDNNSRILEANGEIVIYINISYVNEVSSNRFVNNKYIDNNIVSLELSNNLNESNETIKYVINPNTDTGYIIVLILIILLSILIILLIRNRKAKKYIAILLVLLIPITIYALEKIKLEVETYVEIYKLDTFSMNFQCLYDASLEGEVINNARYEKGMTLEDYINSKYFDELKDNVKTYLENILNYDSLDFIYNEIEDCYAETVWPERNSPNYFEEITIAREHDRICGEKYHKTNIARNDLILSMDEGYYTSEYLCDFN